MANRKKERITENHVVPLRVMISVQSGRQYLMAYAPRFKRITLYRLDNIVTVKAGDVSDRFDELREKLDEMQTHMWGVSTESRSDNRMEHIEFTVRYNDEERHIPRRLEREKRIGQVEHIDAHAIEVDQAKDSTYYLVIHSGSRNLGKQVAEIYQQLAIDLHTGKEEYFNKCDEIIRTFKAQGRRAEIQEALKQLKQNFKTQDLDAPNDICWLYGSFMEDYLHDLEICQKFAKRSRERMAEIIIDRIRMTGAESFHTIHNYIDVTEMILRKGAIAAHAGEKVLIPINMRDGSVLASGKGNAEWNNSAPHGARRILSRTKAKQTIELEEYKASMQGIYSTSINVDTLDEAPIAYKSLDDIINLIRNSVDIIDVMKPVFNFKASDQEMPWKKKGDRNERKDTDTASKD